MTFDTRAVPNWAETRGHLPGNKQRISHLKRALGEFGGRVSVVFGTHTHIPTADERVLPGGTAYITDLGMTGPYDSVLGRRKDRVLRNLITTLPAPFDECAAYRSILQFEVVDVGG